MKQRRIIDTLAFFVQTLQGHSIFLFTADILQYFPTRCQPFITGTFKTDVRD